MKMRKFGSLKSEIALTNASAPAPVWAGGVCGRVKQ